MNSAVPSQESAIFLESLLVAHRGESHLEADLAYRSFGRPRALAGTEAGVAAVGTIGSFVALTSAAACCVLPLAFASVGLGAAGLAAFVPYHWPLTIFAAVVVAAGWLLYMRRRRTGAPTLPTFVMLSVATLFVALSAIWPSYLEQPLMRLFGGA